MGWTPAPGEYQPKIGIDDKEKKEMKIKEQIRLNNTKDRRIYT